MPGALPKRLFTLVLAAALAGSLGISPAKAGGIFEIIHPEVEEGKAEFEFLTTVLLTDIAPGAERSIHELAFGFGLTDYWKPVLGFEIANARGGTPVVEAIEIGNVFILHGGHGHDDEDHAGDDHSDFTFGFFAGAELPVDGGGKPNLSIGPIGEAGIGPVTFLGNLLLEVPTSPEAPGVSYAFGASVPVSGAIAIGLEAHGSFDQLLGQNAPRLGLQEHFAGPAVYAEFEAADGLILEPRAALLFGLTKAAADMALSVNFELKF